MEPPQKRFRFTIETDIYMLREEVVCADPFSNPTDWEDVLRNVMTAVNRELTICGIKERVDLLIDYFRQQDTANLRKSGTEEQYEEREQLLQDVFDLMREVDYAPRTVPRKRNSMGPSKKKKKRRGTATARSTISISQDAQSPGSANLGMLQWHFYLQSGPQTTDRKMMRQQQQICCCQSMRMDLSEPPHREDGTAGDSTTTSPAGEVPAVAPGVPAAAPGVRLFRGNAFAPASVTDFYPDLLSD
ncbi:hypothetical protein MRX96_028913 [Rhipicephalus microplus]